MLATVVLYFKKSNLNENMRNKGHWNDIFK